MTCNTFQRTSLCASALLIAAISGCGATSQNAKAPALESHAGKAPTFIKDDYARALREARSANKPLFVDASAVWCHTCKSMRAFVFADAALAPEAARFVWLELDVEKPENAAFVQKMPVSVLPMFLVLDPVDESVQGKWLGAASLKQLRTFLGDAERQVLWAHLKEQKDNEPLTHLRDADRAALSKDYPRAAASYERALAYAPADWARRADTLTSWIEVLVRNEDWSACLNLAEAHLGETGHGSLATDFSDHALSCVEHVSPNEPRAEKLRGAILEHLSSVLADPEAVLSDDDRSDAYRLVIELHDKRGDKKSGRELAEKRRLLLDNAAKRAPDAESASTFDGARMETYLYLGRGDDAIALLQRSEKALPTDYNPAHRLARTYFTLGKYQEALGATERALTLAYGQRRATILGLQADTLEKLERYDDAYRSLTQQLEVYRALPRAQSRPKLEEKTETRLKDLKAKLGKSASP